MGETIDMDKLDIDELEEISSWFAKTGQKENVEVMNEYISMRLYQNIKGGVEDPEYIVESCEESESDEDDCVDELNIKVCIDEDGFYYML